MRNLDCIKGGHFVIVFIDSTEFLIHRIGLANTLLDDQHARRISGALRSLVDLSPGHEPETLELHRMVFQAATRRELLTEARRADVNLLLSDPNGPALRSF